MERESRLNDGKALPILGIVVAVLGALTVSILKGDVFPFFVLAAMAVLSFFLFKEGGTLAMVLGGLAALDALLALLFYAPLGGKDGNLIPDLPQFFEEPWLATLLTFGVAYVLIARRNAMPAWALYGGLAAAAIRIVVAAMTEKRAWGLVTEPLNLVGLILGLLLVGPLVMAMRSAADAKPMTAGPAAKPAAKPAASHAAPHKSAAHAAPKKK